MLCKYTKITKETDQNPIRIFPARIIILVNAAAVKPILHCHFCTTHQILKLIHLVDWSLTVLNDEKHIRQTWTDWYDFFSFCKD